VCWAINAGRGAYTAAIPKRSSEEHSVSSPRDTGIVGVVRPRYMGRREKSICPLKITRRYRRPYFPMIRSTGVTRRQQTLRSRHALNNSRRKLRPLPPSISHMAIEGLTTHFGTDIGGGRCICCRCRGFGASNRMRGNVSILLWTAARRARTVAGRSASAPGALASCGKDSCSRKR